MHGCEGCRELLLEYLYDLLDGADRQALEAHLASCSACQAALVKVQGQQRLLAAAARIEFPDVRFEPPVDAPAAQPPAPVAEPLVLVPEPPAPVPDPVLLPLPEPSVRQRPGRRRSWGRWAMAAAVLLALAGLGGSSAWVGKDYLAARQVVAHQEAVVAEAQEQLLQAKDELADAKRECDQAIENVRQAVKDRELRLVVSGPRTVQSGAPAEYQVRTYDLAGVPSSARVVAQLTAESSAMPERPEALALGMGGGGGGLGGRPSFGMGGFQGYSAGSPVPGGAPTAAGGGSSVPGSAPAGAAGPRPTPATASGLKAEPAAPAVASPGKADLAARDAAPAERAKMAAPADSMAKDAPSPESAPPGASASTVAEADRKGGEKNSLGVDVAKKAPGEPLPVEDLGKGVYRVTVPPNLRLQPDQQLTMVVSAQREDGSATVLSERVQLTNPVYLTHLTTDKPMYQPGEWVRFRSLTVDRFSLEPAGEDFRFRYTLTTPTGEVRPVLGGRNALNRGEAKDKNEVLGPDGQPVRGVGAGEVYLEPATTVGGEFTLTVSEDSGRFPPQTRKFLVNRYQKPRLDKKLDFNRPSYGPGDEVVASCSATRADSGPVKNRPVHVTVTVDDQTYDQQGNVSDRPFITTTDEHGKVLVRFKLPAAIERGQGSVSVGFDDGGGPETLVRTLPLVLKKLSVEFFPEGGDLVAGLPNRVYFTARTPAGKPAELKGRILQNDNELPIEVATLHDDKQPGANQGMGAFTFTPRFGQRYELRVDSPVGINARVSLPEPRDDGVVLKAGKGVFSADEPIRVQVLSTRPRSLMVGAYCRGRLLDSVQVPKGKTDVELRPTTGVGGVCRVTVFEETPTAGPQQALRPVAERLVYRQPRERLDVTVTAHKRRYVPGQKATLSLATTNEREKLKPSMMMLAVVDKSVVTLADEKTARGMPTHFLLTTEVRNAEDLEYADFLLKPDQLAYKALDLLLGTQGWRRFAEQNPELFRRRLQEEATRLAGDSARRVEEDGERLLVMIGQSSSKTTGSDQRKIAQAQAEFAARAAELAAHHREAKEVVQDARNDEAYRANLARLEGYHKLLTGLGEVGGPILGGACLLLALGLFVAGLRRGLVGGIPCYAGAVGCVAVLLAALLFPRHWPMPAAPAPVDLGDLTVPAEPVPLEEKTATERNEAVDGVNATAIAPAPTSGGMPSNVPGMMRGIGMATAPAPVPVAPMAPPAKPLEPGRGGYIPPPSMAPAPAGKPGKAMLGRPGLFGAGEAKQDWALDAFRKETKATKDQQRTPLVRGAQIAQGAERPAAPAPPAGKKEVAEAEALKEREEKVEKVTERLPRQRAFDDLGRRMRQRDIRDREESAAVLPMVVREYAHQLDGNKDGPRSDFAETLYWHPVLVLPNGKAEVSFSLCDSVTNFQVIAVAHTLDGRLGTGSANLEVRQPLTVQPKLPLEVTASDRIDVPVLVANNTGERRKVQVDLKAHNGLALAKGGKRLDLDAAPETPARGLYSLRPAIAEGTADLYFEGRAAGGAADAIRESVRVVPEGFPVARSSSDLLERSATHTVQLPGEWVPGTLRAQVDVYPSTLADLQKGLESLLREPHGCFEQASTCNYPNVLILDYLKENRQARPEVERRARELLAQGYQKLTSFECLDPAQSKKRGYEWFGGTAPPHEALTAYGLLQFRDMARLHDVDPAMLKRTREYLLDRRDGKGGFERNAKAVDSFGRAPADVTDAYIVWALTEGGKDEDLKVELNSLVERAKKSKDPYFLALVAGSLVNRNRNPEAQVILRTVAGLQKEDGHLEALQTSITGSGGRDLMIETTALAVLGWLKANPGEFAAPIEKAARWIGKQRSGSGGFGSTQSTILALKALLAHARERKRSTEAGEIHVYVGDTRVASRPFAAGVAEPMTLVIPDAEKNLKAGKNKVRIDVTGKSEFPHTVSWSYSSLKPDSSPACPVKLTTALARTDLREGDVVRLTVQVENVSGQGQGMATAIVGLPSGLSLPEDLKQLKEHARLPEAGKRPLLSAFEVRGRELVLYWRNLGPGEKVRLPLDLIARIPGEYRGPASRAYLYYNADLKHWVEPIRIRIAARP